MTTPLPTSDLASLVGALQDPSQPEPVTTGLLLETISRSAARLAPRDFGSRGLLDDVVSRALELLCRRPAGHFDPTRGPVEGYLMGIVRTAIRDVRDENQWAVDRHRNYATQAESSRPAIAEPTCQLESHVGLATDLQERLRGRPELRLGAILIAFEGQCVIRAADASGVSRFTLKRQLRRYLASLDLAA